MKPEGPFLASVELDGGVFLRRGAFRRSGTLRFAGELQHGPGKPVHHRGVPRRYGIVDLKDSRKARFIRDREEDRIV